MQLSKDAEETQNTITELNRKLAAGHPAGASWSITPDGQHVSGVVFHFSSGKGTPSDNYEIKASVVDGVPRIDARRY